MGNVRFLKISIVNGRLGLPAATLALVHVRPYEVYLDVSERSPDEVLQPQSWRTGTTPQKRV